MLFCHKIHNIFMINALFPRNFVVLIYALFPPIFLSWKVVSANFFAFWMYYPRIFLISSYPSLAEVGVLAVTAKYPSVLAQSATKIPSEMEVAPLY